MNPIDAGNSLSGATRSALAGVRRIPVAAALAAAATLAATSGAMAFTAQEQFLNTVEKVAPFVPAKAKRLCRCTTPTDPGVGELRARVESSNGTEDYGVHCEVPRFDPTNGSLQSTRPCVNGQFEVLPK